MQNNTTANIANQAGQLVNNSVLQGQIDAVGTDINRNLTENTIPQLNATASNNGNMDSTRAGVAKGIYERGANENLTNAAANMRASAYNQGTSLAAGVNATNINASNTTANTANYAAGESLQGQTANNTNNTNNLNTQVAGTNLADQQAQIGNGLLTTGAALNSGGAQLQIAGGGVYQADQQAQDNANVQAFSNAQAYPWQAIDNASNVVQHINWGTTGTTGTIGQTNPSNLSNAISVGGLAGSLFASGNSNTGAGAGILSGVGPGILSSAGGALSNVGAAFASGAPSSVMGPVQQGAASAALSNAGSYISSLF